MDDAGNVLETFDYYPFGLLMPKRNTAGANTIEKFTSKERDEEGGLNLDYFGARYYDAAIGRWHSVDPLADDYPAWSAYNYTFNNPSNLIDPDGLAPLEVIIRGEKSDEAFDQLNSSTSLMLKKDENGKVTASGKAKSEADKALLEAINSEDVVVNINATSSDFTESGNWFVGGAFGGSEINDEGQTVTSQTVNPSHAETIDEFYELGEGVTTLHEVIESYFGGKDSPGAGMPTFGSEGTPAFNAYKNAHDKAVSADPRFKSPHISVGPNGSVFISKFPYDPQIPKKLNPEIQIIKGNN